ncbi:hypothetical protein FOZ63_016324, partial [Perkinsus olseni]
TLTAIIDTGCTDSIINKHRIPQVALNQVQPLQRPTTVTCLNTTTVDYTHYVPLTWSFKNNAIEHSTNFVISEDPLPSSIDIVIGLKTQQHNNFYLNPITNTISTNGDFPSKTSTHNSPTPATTSPNDSLYANLDYDVSHIICDGPWLRVYQVQTPEGPRFLADVSIKTREEAQAIKGHEKHIHKKWKAADDELRQE